MDRTPAKAWRFAMFLVARSLAQPYAGELHPRSDPHSIILPLVADVSQQWDGIDGPWSSFALRVGDESEAQNVRVFPSTKSTSTWTVNYQGCPDGFPADCQDSRGGIFLSNESTSWVENHDFDVHVDDNLGLDGLNADFGFDTVALGWQGTSAPNLSHQVVANFANTPPWLGVFPLNPRPTNFTDMDEPQESFVHALKNQSLIPSLSWAYTAGAHYRYSGDVFGSLILGGYDASRFVASPNLTLPFGEDQERDLVVGLTSITTSTSTALLLDPINVLIDSTVPYLYLPQSACDAFASAFSLTWDNTSSLYLVNDTHYSTLLQSDETITFALSQRDSAITSGTTTLKIEFPIAALLLNASFPLVADGSSRYMPLQPINDTNSYTLGRVFLQEAYLIADYERSDFTVAACSWPDGGTFQQNIMTIAPVNGTTSNTTHNTNSLSGGAIAGIVIGGVVGGLLLAYLVLVLRRRRQRNRRASSSKSTAAHTRSTSNATTLAGSRPRAGSRLASFLTFRNPWSGPGEGGGGGVGAAADGSDRYELAVDPAAPTPAEEEMARRQNEHKRHFSGELDGIANGVYEMYQPKRVIPEVEGDAPLPTYWTHDGATIDANMLRMAHQQQRGGGGDGDAEMGPSGEVYEMEAAGLGGQSPPLPSPGQLRAVELMQIEGAERNEERRREAEAEAEAEAERGDGEGLLNLSPISDRGGRQDVDRPDVGSRRVSRD